MSFSFLVARSTLQALLRSISILFMDSLKISLYISFPACLSSLFHFIFGVISLDVLFDIAFSIVYLIEHATVKWSDTLRFSKTSTSPILSLKSLRIKYVIQGLCLRTARVYVGFLCLFGGEIIFLHEFFQTLLPVCLVGVIQILVPVPSIDTIKYHT